MALCDTEIKNQVKPLSEFNNMDKKLDSMTWIKAIKNGEFRDQQQSTCKA